MFEQHFGRIRALKAFERRFLSHLVDNPGSLTRPREALFRYAINLAKLEAFRTPDGDDVDVVEVVAPLRQWMIEHLVPLLPEQGEPEWSELRRIAPQLSLRLDRTRSEVLDRHDDDFGPSDLDDELRQKRLVIVLGGGGGAGLYHLGTFALLEELDLVPELIVGSSMGSVMGLLRATDRSYDPFEAARVLPGDLESEQIFRPFTGYSRYGFPGAFHLNLQRVGRRIFEKMFGTPDVRFDDLAIPLEIVTCGIRKGYELDAERYAAAAEETEEPAPVGLREKLRLFFDVARQLAAHPGFLDPVVFGRDAETEAFPVIEAVGFSCAVPGLLHFDIFHDDPATVRPLEALFERHDLVRLCDGGVVNNVPSRIAWESIRDGKIGSRNTFIAAFDVFAPVPSRDNAIWLPIQQLVRPTVLANRPYADFHKTFHSPPSPLNVLLEEYNEVEEIVGDAREELGPQVDLFERAMERLPPYGTWPIGGS